MKKNRYPALIAALTLGAGLTVPAQAEPPSWAPAHGHRAKQEREYRYVYYPLQRVYYATEQQIWFWMNGSNWNFGVHLPAQFRPDSSPGLPVMLRSHRPYIQHRYVEERYGRPWREQHRRDEH